MVIDINVKGGEFIWQNERKEHGFIKIEDTEVSLPHSTIDRFGLVRIFTGNKVTVSLTVNKYGEVI